MPCSGPSSRYGLLFLDRSGFRSQESLVKRARRFLAFVTIGVAILASFVGWAARENRRWRSEELPKLHSLTTRLHLSDLALWTEARYTRHPSQADLFSAFQDSPGAPEHFPAGSVLSPPPALEGVPASPDADGGAP